MSETVDSAAEVWKAILGFEGKYFVSSLGRVSSNARKELPEPFVLKQSKSTAGYFQVNLRRPGGYSTRSVHRLVMTAFNPTSADGLEVNHLDGDKRNNRLSNLEWCTSLENKRHYRIVIQKLPPKVKIKKIREYAKGEQHYAHKLTEDKVREIRQLFADGARQTELGGRFGVSQHTIWCVVTGRKWSHVV